MKKKKTQEDETNIFFRTKLITFAGLLQIKILIDSNIDKLFSIENLFYIRIEEEKKKKEKKTNELPEKKKLFFFVFLLL